VSPILVRPVREQLEHDRLIRHLQQKYKRKFDVALNIGEEQGTPVKVGPVLLFPDLVLMTGRKLAGVIEVETSESVNNLEAMAQWVHFAKSRVPFHLYVPVTAYETARRLCDANQAQVSEVWTYRPSADGFDLVRMSADSPPSKARGLAAIIVTLPPKPAAPVAAPPPPSAPPPAPVVPKPAPPAPAAKSTARPTTKKPVPSKPRAAAKPSRKPAPRSRKPAARKRTIPARRRR
jgi:hypothetical protein